MLTVEAEMMKAEGKRGGTRKEVKKKNQTRMSKGEC